ncbi:MAG TPA: hypothetical protein VH087_17020 [Thermoanaerobaculia bacterium]|nr:hypothetical protein [Thermoanaerobaculia bacterium]
MRRTLLVLCLCVATAIVPASAQTTFSTDNNASCDIGYYPAATLLLPYFEVDINSSTTTALSTTVTVVNTSKQPQIVRATVWTDMGYPIFWFNLFLTGYDAQSLSLYEVLVRGRLPITSSSSAPGRASASNASNPYTMQNTLCDSIAGSIAPPLLQRIQSALTTGVMGAGACPVGTAHKNAIGYITLDVVNSCSDDSPLDAKYWNDVLLYDNVLTGDYIRINPSSSGKEAGANPLVHVRAIPESGPSGARTATPFPYTFYDRYAHGGDRRQPLPSIFGVRFIDGGPTAFLTSLTIWREGTATASNDPCDYAANAKLALPHTNVVRFDEHENATVNASDGSTPASLLLPANSPILPPVSAAGDHGGWFWLSLDNGRMGGAMKRPSQNWIIVQMNAEGRYGVDFDATFLANGCTTSPAAAPYDLAHAEARSDH